MMRRLLPITWKACFVPEPTKGNLNALFRIPGAPAGKDDHFQPVSTESRGRLRPEVPAPENGVRRRWPEVQEAWERGPTTLWADVTSSQAAVAPIFSYLVCQQTMCDATGFLNFY
jgi:hypothetical protein